MLHCMSPLLADFVAEVADERRKLRRLEPEPWPTSRPVLPHRESQYRDGITVRRHHQRLLQQNRRQSGHWLARGLMSAPDPKDGVIGRQLVVSGRFWVLRFRLMVKRGP